MSNEYKDWRDDRVQDLIIEKYNLHITYYNPQRDGAYVGGYDNEDESRLFFIEFDTDNIREIL